MSKLQIASLAVLHIFHKPSTATRPFRALAIELGVHETRRICEISETSCGTLVRRSKAVQTNGSVAVAVTTFTVVTVCNGTVGGRACNRWPFVAGAAGGDTVASVVSRRTNVVTTHAIERIGRCPVDMSARRANPAHAPPVHVLGAVINGIRAFCCGSVH